MHGITEMAIPRVKLRAIRWRDWRYLARLSLEAFPDATPRQVSATLRDETHIVVLEIDGRPAGYGAFRHERDALLWRDWMAVDPRYRSQGYGAMLVDAVEAIAVSRGYSAIMLAVLKSNEGAFRFHCSHGYEVAGEDGRKYHLRKKLGIPAAEPPPIPAVPRPRSVGLFMRMLYWLTVHFPARMRA